MNKIFLLGITAVIALVAFALTTTNPTHSQERYDPRNVPETLMQDKLRQAQIMLEAIAIEDYERIGTSALRLKDISLEAQWVTARSELYGLYGEEFRSNLNRVMTNVERKNLEGAALHFFNTITTCIQCHKALRDGLGFAAQPQAPGETNNLMARLLETQTP